MELVAIKAYAKGLILICDASCTFEELIYAIADKFHNGRKFFGTSKVSIELKGRSFNNEEILFIMKTIRLNSDLGILAVVGCDEDEEELLVRRYAELKTTENEENKATILKQSVISGEIKSNKGNFIVFGNVEKDAVVRVSNGNCVILGNLLGAVYLEGKDANFVCALDWNPSNIEINNNKYKPKTKLLGFSKTKPQIAKVIDGQIEVMDWTKEISYV